jgi:hypothetical protein
MFSRWGGARLYMNLIVMGRVCCQVCPFYPRKQTCLLSARPLDTPGGYSDLVSKCLMSLFVNEAGSVRIFLDFVICAADS